MKIWPVTILALCLSMGGAAAGEKAVRIGVLGDQSGPFADLGGPGAVLAAQMAAEDHGGKANGKPIEIVSADTQNKPDIASAIARSWFDTQGVDAIVDVPLSSVAIAIQGVARQMKKVVLLTAPASTELTGAQCSPYSVHWMDDTRALSVGTARAVVASGGKRWFFLTPDYAFGTAMESAATKSIVQAGGSISGGVKYPLGTQDYASFLLTAAASDAEIFGLSSVGGDTVAAVKQANEFGLTDKGRKIVLFLTFIPEIHAIGLERAHGLYITDGFYWDENDQTRAWSKRFFAKMNRMPSKSQAYTYAAVRHYLKAIDAAHGEDAAAVIAEMRKLPADYFGKPAQIRKNGRVLYDLTLYEVKTPAESAYPWDYYKPVRKITAEEAFGAEDPGECQLR